MKNIMATMSILGALLLSGCAGSQEAAITIDDINAAKEAAYCAELAANKAKDAADRAERSCKQAESAAMYSDLSAKKVGKMINENSKEMPK